MNKINFPLEETETIEFKKSTAELNEGLESIISIINKNNIGILFFGIDDSGNVVGQDVTDSTIKRIANKIDQCIKPRIFPEIIRHDIPDSKKQVIEIKFKGYEPLYNYDGKYKIRVGTTNRILQSDEIEKRIVRWRSIEFDSLASDLDIGDIDINAYLEFLKKAKINDLNINDIRYGLNKLNLLSNDGKLFNSCKLLFSTDAKIKVRMYCVDKKIIYNDTLAEDNIWNLIDKCINYVKLSTKNIKVFPGDKMSKSDRQSYDKSSYPIRAIRELIINSLIHREYIDERQNEIIVKNNSLEIYNPGIFMGDVEPNQYIDGHGKSKLRNHNICRILYKSGDIEQFGTGISESYKLCSEEKIQLSFVKMQDGFRVVLNKFNIDEYEEQHVRNNLLDDVSELNQNEIELLWYLKKHSNSKSDELSNILHLSKVQTINILNKLCIGKFILKKGKSRNSRYFFNVKMKDKFILSLLKTGDLYLKENVCLTWEDDILENYILSFDDKHYEETGVPRVVDIESMILHMLGGYGVKTDSDITSINKIFIKDLIEAVENKEHDLQMYAMGL